MFLKTSLIKKFTFWVCVVYEGERNALSGNHALPFANKTVEFSWNLYRDPSQDFCTLSNIKYFLEAQMNYLALYSYVFSVATRCYMLA